MLRDCIIKNKKHPTQTSVFVSRIKINKYFKPIIVHYTYVHF